VSVRDPDVQKLALCVVNALKLAMSGPELDVKYIREIWRDLDALPDDIRADVMALTVIRLDRGAREQRGVSLIEFWDAWRMNQIH
jgi:hypothetical protein